jgi:hypothetical protein
MFIGSLFFCDKGIGKSFVGSHNSMIEERCVISLSPENGVSPWNSLSVFDFEHHGNSKYGSPYQTSKDRRSSQGKM